MNFFIILLLSFCINLFSLCIYKYLGFFVIPESIFLCLLLTGIPFGAALGIKFIKKITLAKSILFLIPACVLSYIGIFRLFQIQVILFRDNNAYSDLSMKYLILFVTEWAYFLPFFMAYGFCEFICYSRMDLPVKKIYSGFLIGCALAFLCMRIFVNPVGVFRFSLLSIAGVCLIFYVILNNKSLIAKVLIFAVFLTAAFPFFLTNFEANVTYLMSGTHKNPKVILEEWNEYCYFSLLKNQDQYVAFYNWQPAWVFPGNPHLVLQDQLPYRLIGDNKDIAVLGSGGGLQIEESLPFTPKSLDAVEIIPAVIHLLKDRYSLEFYYIYNQPFVNTHLMDGRKFLEKSSKAYDLIYMASTDGPLKFSRTLLEMHQSLSTREAFEIMHKRLKENGILAIRQNNFFRYYFTSLQAVGFKVFAYKKRRSDADSINSYYWLIAVKTSDQTTYQNYLSKLHREDIFFDKYGYERVEKVENYPLQTITDDKPMKGKILLDLIPKNFVDILFGGLFFITALVSAVLIALLKYFWIKKDHTEKLIFWKIGFTAFMVGINFIILENFIIYKLNYYLSVPLDAICVGIIMFVTFAAIGASLLSDKFKPTLLYLCLFMVFAVLIFQKIVSTPIILALMIIPFIFSGTFFPTILRGDDDKKLVVYVFDGIGAFIGAVISFSIPLLIGFRMFYIIALIIFFLTAISVTVFRAFWYNNVDSK